MLGMGPGAREVLASEKWGLNGFLWDNDITGVPPPRLEYQFDYLYICVYFDDK